MARRLKVPPEAEHAQGLSSDPAASAWVSANAGAGKTFVLARRVVRLLLSGVAPRAILCLTFTNAAAAEMAQRVYKVLADLATLPEEGLREAVAALAPEADPAEAAARARTLFAEALETPGGLKVQTIHAFAAALLRRFPLEANVSGSFQVLDDATRQELESRAVASVLARGAANPEGPEAGAIAALLPHVSDYKLPHSMKAVLAERRRLIHWIGRGADVEAPDFTPADLDIDPQAVEADLRAALGLEDPHEPPCVFDDEACRRLVAVIEEKGKSLQVAERLRAALEAPENERDKTWRRVFFTTEGERRKLDTFVAAAIRKEIPDLLERVEAEQDRLEALAERQRGEAAVAATVPLLTLGWAALELFEAEKRRRGFVDYDDQIARAVLLVREATDAAWVRFKLDEGIDHMMVDEAQDTSPDQWALVGALADEFFAGEGAREVTRTLFVVGDEKQSIYSFQGAAPRLFAQKRVFYGERAAAAGLRFHAVELAHSFRSAPQVLSAVDRVFGTDSLARAVGAAPGDIRHVPILEERGGVDVWPLFSDTPAEQPQAWDAPFDQTPDHAGNVKLVKAIADRIEEWTGERGPDGGPPVGPGDIMVLSRKRQPLATLMNRELKARGISVAGSDRLDVTAHIAVMDMTALARALLTQDDLSLAAVLKSPLFGFDDADLFAVAHCRRGSLMQALAAGDETARAAHATLTRWRGLARSLRPFDFFAGILVGEGRRADFAARMGSEAEDALDAFLDLALAFEGRGVPALETFLDRLSRAREELRRSAEGAGDAVRVMTVHGAKGLESKVVFLADVGSEAVPSRPVPELVHLPLAGSNWEGEALLFSPTKEHSTQAVRRVIDEKREREMAEHHRLLYVGMTRAERHLVVCGSYGKRAPKEGMWHGLVFSALEAEAEAVAQFHGTGLRWRVPTPAPFPEAPACHAPAEKAQDAPDWLWQPAVLCGRAPEPIAPSEGDHAPAGDGAGGRRTALPAADYGALVHALLERGGGAEDLRALALRLHPALSQTQLAGVVEEARAALDLPELDARTVRREMDVIGDVRLDGTVRRASGRIDRLQIGDGTALVIDFKTDRAVPAGPFAAPVAYRRQLAIYRALAGAMLPGLRVSAAIVWTAAPAFMKMDGALPPVTAA